MDSLSTFESHRDRLFGVAYRMTGSVADARDICQDAWLRWQVVDSGTVDNAEAFLVRIVTRLAIDRSRSASARRESYVGPYLPEPLLQDRHDDPQAAAEVADSMTFAFLVLLDELSPIERAVFLLHDVFAYSFDEIALSVDRSAPACRQIASRTRRRISEHRVTSRRPNEGVEQLLINELITKTIEGDIEALMRLLAPDIVQLDDGGPPRKAARRPIVGADRVARFMVNLAKRFGPHMTMESILVNESTGFLFKINGKPDMVMAIEWTPDNLVQRIFVQLNPDKLRHIATTEQ